MRISILYSDFNCFFRTQILFKKRAKNLVKNIKDKQERLSTLKSYQVYQNYAKVCQKGNLCMHLKKQEIVKPGMDY